MRIVITGAAGFIGGNLAVRLSELRRAEVTALTRDSSGEQVQAAFANADFVFHLAGTNRPLEEADFVSGNVLLTESLCSALARNGRQTRIAYASSTQATLENPYGRSKRAAEELLLSYGRATGAAVYLLRLTNVFGKWCRPYYNSVIATFCHQLTHGLATTVNDPAAPLRLLYVDDVIARLVQLLDADQASGGYVEVAPVYETTVGEVEQTLRAFAHSRSTLTLPPVGTGLARALYATYISYLSPQDFSYAVPRHGDPRGVFVEMLKTPDCGQFSYFTAGPGITRGEHYHHTKTEKFLIISGTARFGFRNIRTGQTLELLVRGAEGRIVESVPGWAHDVTNVGDDELVIMLWANEVFDRSRPDTVAVQVSRAEA